MSEAIEATLSLSSDGKSLLVAPASLEANYVYSISITGLKDNEGNPVDDISIEYQTPYSPMYASVREMAAIKKQFDISDEDMRQYIHNGSAEAEFIQTCSGASDSENTSYAKKQYAKTKATYDIILDSFMSRTSHGGGAEYTLDVATYKDSLNSTAYNKLLDKLKNDLAYWSDAIRGYTLPGRAKPKATRAGIKSSQNNDVKWTTVDSIINDMGRSIPQWS